MGRVLNKREMTVISEDMDCLEMMKRKDYGVSLRKELGISQSYVSRIEKKALEKLKTS